MRRLRTLALTAVAQLWRLAAQIQEHGRAVWPQVTRFYRPQGLRITGLGLINEEEVFFATESGISGFHDGFLTPLVHTDHATPQAFHLCHHRNSIFYEALGYDSGELTIFEYSLVARRRERIQGFQDAAPATALACIDRMLLRASPSSLLAVHLQSNRPPSVLREFHLGAAPVTSLSVGFAADVYTRAQIFALVSQNRSLLRLRLTPQGDDLAVSAASQELLSGGSGSDGPIGSATAYDPRHILWSHGNILFTDGCSLREIRDANVRTLVGSPADCVRPANESLELAPWATRLSRPKALAGASDGTVSEVVLFLTGAQVSRVASQRDACTQHLSEQKCSQQLDCGWAEGSGHSLCFGCELLRLWAASQRPPVDPCSLEGASRASTRYGLASCGCLPPGPQPSSGGRSWSGADAVQVMLSIIVLWVGTCAALLVYRAHRRAVVINELYGVDTAEFHVFNDEDSS